VKCSDSARQRIDELFQITGAVQQAVVSPYRCNEFSAKSTLLTRPTRHLPTDPTYGWSVWMYPDQSRPEIYWLGYIPTSPDLAKNYSGLVCVEHWLTPCTKLLSLHSPLLSPFPPLLEFPLLRLSQCGFLSRGWDQTS